MIFLWIFWAFALIFQYMVFLDEALAYWLKKEKYTLELSFINEAKDLRQELGLPLKQDIPKFAFQSYIYMTKTAATFNMVYLNFMSFVVSKMMKEKPIILYGVKSLHFVGNKGIIKE